MDCLIQVIKLKVKDRWSRDSRGLHSEDRREEGEMVLLLLRCHVAVTCLFISVSFSHWKNETKSCCYIYMKGPSVGAVGAHAPVQNLVMSVHWVKAEVYRPHRKKRWPFQIKFSLEHWEPCLHDKQEDDLPNKTPLITGCSRRRTHTVWRAKNRKSRRRMPVHLSVNIRVRVCLWVSIFRHVDMPPQAILFCVTMEMTEPNCQFALEKRGKWCRAPMCECLCVSLCVYERERLMCIHFKCVYLEAPLVGSCVDVLVIETDKTVLVASRPHTEALNVNLTRKLNLSCLSVNTEPFDCPPPHSPCRLYWPFSISANPPPPPNVFLNTVFLFLFPTLCFPLSLCVSLCICPPLAEWS